MEHYGTSLPAAIVQVVQDQDCSYLPGLAARLCYRLIPNCSAARYQAMLERGWRRFGCTFFRPVCLGCSACRSLRVDTDRFTSNRSMRRTRAKNRDLEVFLRPASASPEQLRLYERYHRDMAQRKSWTYRPLGTSGYRQTFVDGRRDYGHELLYRLDGRLVAVALVDLLPRALSAVYCYYEPTLRHRGLGTFSVLRQIELAQELSIPFVYLGFRVEGNASTRYKGTFKPHQILHGRPDDDQPPLWNEVG
ncbi:MAG: arginyltransferase [Acidobacteriota bacterium]